MECDACRARGPVSLPHLRGEPRIEGLERAVRGWLFVAQTVAVEGHGDTTSAERWMTRQEVLALDAAAAAAGVAVGSHSA
ncbi:conserved protein of unknown function [Rhodovastum atsumiense]|uniref:Uncharacterized protein n=1 Tax=Rhodovastum atsumiense TaxID=504468 RepID=A0A5M6INH2_9PROT|nr:hypothetical protein [Rhodovastum atsumiense]KAA5609810.1 hypothetical protein F1189_22220 [Rhodovastum atsumiense]CAH2603715.1 conserved protein of unknown function [Rhodovastum atsumiense]